MTGAKEDDEKPPEFWEWLGRQHLNADPERAAAAAYVRSRWDLGPWYRNNSVLRALEQENSEHFRGLQLLSQDYGEQFDVNAKAEVRERLGAISPLIQVYREQCEQCSRDAIPGTMRCSFHGGSWITEEERASVSQAIQERLLLLSTQALSVLTDLMDNAKSEKVRYDSASFILQTSGFQAAQKIEISVTDQAQEAAAEIQARILRLKSVKNDDDDAIDAEVVEDESA